MCAKSSSIYITSMELQCPLVNIVPHSLWCLECIRIRLPERVPERVPELVTERGRKRKEYEEIRRRIQGTRNAAEGSSCKCCHSGLRSQQQTPSPVTPHLIRCCTSTNLIAIARSLAIIRCSASPLWLLPSTLPDVNGGGIPAPAHAAFVDFCTCLLSFFGRAEIYQNLQPL